MNIIKKSLFYLLYNAIVVAVVFLLAEFSLNFLLNHPSIIPHSFHFCFEKYYFDYDREIIQYNEGFAKYDRGLYYKLKPGKFVFSNREFSNSFFVNKMGLRDDEMSLNKPEIIFLGDSHTMGWGVDQDSTFAQRVEKMSGKNVLNTGISSFGTARELSLLKELNTSNLKYLVIQYCANDYQENKEHYNDKIFKASDRNSYEYVCKQHKEVTGYRLFKHLTTLTDIARAGVGGEAIIAQPDSSEVNPFFAFLNILVASQKIQHVSKIILFSIDSHKSDDEFIKGVKEQFKKEQFKSLEKKLIFIDFTSKLNKDNFYILDDHMNDGGHRIVAEEIMRIIK